MKQEAADAKMMALWRPLQKKFCHDLRKDFSNKDVAGWLAHFVPNSKVDVFQNGSDVTGKNGESKTVKVFTGGFLASLFKGRIPAKVMASVLFKRLSKQGYAHSEIQLLGIRSHSDTQAQAHVYFERYNQAGEMYEAAVGLYSLKLVQGAWLIYAISTFDDSAALAAAVDIRDMWRPAP